MGFKTRLETRGGNQVVTNEEKAEKMFSEAEKVYPEALTAFKDECWNLAIRRSQEVVELNLKGILYLMGIDYPKIHDVTPILVKTLKERQVDVDQKFLDWLLLFSSDLTLKRAPAFYFEEDYDQETASKVIEGREKIKEFAKNLLKKLKK